MTKRWLRNSLNFGINNKNKKKQKWTTDQFLQIWHKNIDEPPICPPEDR